MWVSVYRTTLAFKIFFSGLSDHANLSQLSLGGSDQNTCPPCFFRHLFIITVLFNVHCRLKFELILRNILHHREVGGTICNYLQLPYACVEIVKIVPAFIIRSKPSDRLEYALRSSFWLFKNHNSRFQSSDYSQVLPEIASPMSPSILSRLRDCGEVIPVSMVTSSRAFLDTRVS